MTFDGWPIDQRETLLLTNGRVRTLDMAGTVAPAIALRDGRILAVGEAKAVAAVAGEDARVFDLSGWTVLPGLIDAHTHLEGTALHLAYYADCHAPPHRDLAGILGALAAHAATLPPGEWAIGQGSFMLAEKLAEGRYPTLAEFDAAVPDRPALIRAGAHITVVNSLALRRLGIDESFTPARRRLRLPRQRRPANRRPDRAVAIRRRRCPRAAVPGPVHAGADGGSGRRAGGATVELRRHLARRPVPLGRRAAGLSAVAPRRPLAAADQLHRPLPEPGRGPGVPPLRIRERIRRRATADRRRETLRRRGHHRRRRRLLRRLRATSRETAATSSWNRTS